MLTSSSAMLTLELSTEPCRSVPRPLRPGVPVCGAPLEPDSSSRFWPMACRPAGLMKAVSCRLPTCVAAVEPGSSTEIVPSEPTVTLCAPSGTVMAGCTW